eukprot:COSAG01_NODE_640_length_14594_cov_14.497896_6_plen_123_part_00
MITLAVLAHPLTGQVGVDTKEMAGLRLLSADRWLAGKCASRTSFHNVAIAILWQLRGIPVSQADHTGFRSAQGTPTYVRPSLPIRSGWPQPRPPSWHWWRGCRGRSVTPQYCGVTERLDNTG